MCESIGHTAQSGITGDKKYRLADFFDSFWDIYVQETTNPISKEQFKAVSSMRVCRTAALGVDYYACPQCGEEVAVYHNCKNRFCPTCSWGDTIKWSEMLNSQMMNVPHRHVVFTLPHALIPLIKGNGKELLNILLRTAADTLKDWVKHKYNLKIGIISVLHTFGETKDYHTHTHMIVSWGGIDPLTGALTPITGEYVNYKFLQSKFRIKFEGELIKLFDQGILKHDFKDRAMFMQFIKRINNTNWQIHLEPPMPCPTAVIRYIGRYSKRACLSEYKITEIEGEYLSFRYKDYKTIAADNKPVEKILRLHYSKFFPRLLQHVPLSYFRLVRYYGLYSTKSHIPQEYLNKPAKETEEIEAVEVSESEEPWEWENPFVCNTCQVKLEYQYTIIDIRPRIERTERFDANLHPSVQFKRAS